MTDIDTILAAHRPGILTTCDCEPGSSRWFEHCWASELEAARRVVAAMDGIIAAMDSLHPKYVALNQYCFSDAEIAAARESKAEYLRVMEEQR